MEIRKVQRTGDMHYVYLPTNWCKKHNISSDSRVNLDENNSGALVISPTEAKQILKNLDISLDEEDQDVINKLIVACYINPLASFKIGLNKEITATKLLNQKNIISLESVEIEKKTISCESNVMLSDPALLLKTMVKKIKNLAVVMTTNYNLELINKYEEEIDRSKLLIQKSTVNYMTYNVPVNLKIIDLYYISLITTDLERVVDHLINLNEGNSEFMKGFIEIMELLKKITDSFDSKLNISSRKEKFNYKTAISFLKKIKSLKLSNSKDKFGYDKRRIKDMFTNVSEIILDWSITNEIES